MQHCLPEHLVQFFVLNANILMTVFCLNLVCMHVESYPLYGSVLPLSDYATFVGF